jgi:O-antigen ligase
MTPGLRWALVIGIEALLIILLLPFGFVFTGSLAVHGFQLLVLAVGGATGWLLVMWRPTTLHPALIVAPLALLAAVVITAFNSPYPSLSWPAVWQTAAYAGVFWLLAFQASHPVGRRNLLAVIGMVVTLALISFLLEVVMAWREWLSLDFPLRSLPLRPLNSGGLALIPTWLADLVGVGSPVLATNLWSRGRRVAATAFALIALGAIVLTGTRSVLLVIAAVSVMAALMAIRGKVGGRGITAVVGAVIAIGIVGIAVALGSSRSFDEGRSSAYTSAVARFTESPFIGVGPGTYGVERMSDPVDVIGHLAFPDAHNVVLNTLAESGLIGLLGLLATVVLLGLAIRRSWLTSPGDRLLIVGALFGVVVFAAHGMVDVIFGLVGIVLVAVAVVAIATTNANSPDRTSVARPAYLRAATGIAFVVVILISGALVQVERTFATIADADAALERAPAEALAIARQATSAAPDIVPGWWVQMAAADAAGDPAAAIAAARKTVELEGFGQQWMSLAILASQQGDRTAELEAIARATAGPPVDPLVELNVMVLLDAAGDRAGAEAAARRLLEVEPDFEPLLRTGPPAMATLAAAVRADVATRRITEGDMNAAFQVALSGGDEVLARRLIAQVPAGDAAETLDWTSIVDAWFGDATARAKLDAAARADPSIDRARWAWRLAGRACDDAGMTFWERAIEIGYSFHPAVPAQLTLAPDGQARDLPILYPTFVWKLDHPKRPFVAGTWTFFSGRPECAPGV